MNRFKFITISLAFGSALIAGCADSPEHVFENMAENGMEIIVESVNNLRVLDDEILIENGFDERGIEALHDRVNKFVRYAASDKSFEIEWDDPQMDKNFEMEEVDPLYPPNTKKTRIVVDFLVERTLTTRGETETEELRRSLELIKVSDSWKIHGLF